MKLVRIEKGDSIIEYSLAGNSLTTYFIYATSLNNKSFTEFPNVREAMEYVTYDAHRHIAHGYSHIGPFFEKGKSYRINDVVYTTQCVVESVFGHLAWMTFHRKVSGAIEVQTMGFPSYLEAELCS